MKNLANCKPTEFLKQTVRIRRAAEKWLKVTDIAGIRRRMPELKPLSPNMSDDERLEVMAENRRHTAEQARENTFSILESVMEKHPDETLEILALCCFVEPSEVDEHPMSEYLLNVSELVMDPAVISFFTSLIQWGQMGIFKAS